MFPKCKTFRLFYCLFYSLMDLQTKTWILILMVFVAASAALEEDDYCKKSAYRICQADKSSYFPLNEEEFDERCPIVLDEFRCIHEHTLICNPDRLEGIAAHYELLQDLCRKDSHLHDAIAKNIGCIKESVTEECSEKIMAVVRAYANSLNETSDDENFAEEYWMKVDCMYDAYAVTCAADSASRQCGSIVKAPIVEIARRIGFLDEMKRCSRNTRQGIIKDIADMEISIEQKLLLQELLLEF